MQTAFSSPSSAPAAPLMPVSDAVQERFIRLPEVMHLCGLSRSVKTWRGRSLKSRHGWQIALPNVTGTMTHDDDRSANRPFFWLASFPRFQV